jgi:Zn-dependent protease
MLGLSAATLITRAVTLVIAFTVHEFSHAWSATALGDETPRTNGRLTLNPLAHLDPLGSLLLLISGFGWARPVPIDPYALQRRHPAGVMLVSAAGPFSNLGLAILAALPIQGGLALAASQGVRASWLPSPVEFLAEFILINLILFFFNLIPLAPLDGEKVLSYFLPRTGQETLLRLRPYGPLILLGLLFVGPRVGLDVFHWIVGLPAAAVFTLLIS